MKKILLLLVYALMCVVAFAGNEWSIKNGEITVAYNSYGKQDEYGTAIQWQAGNVNFFPNAVKEATGNTSWVPALGERFMVTLTGVPNMSGKLQVFMVDERVEANYWTELCATNGEVEIIAGEEFSIKASFTVTNNNNPVALTAPGLILAYIYPGTSIDKGFDATEDFVISNANLEILYAESSGLVDPITTPRFLQDGLTYQFINKNEVALVRLGVLEYNDNYNCSETTIVMGGARSPIGGFYTSDKGVQLRSQAENTIFYFDTYSYDEVFEFMSGTVVGNEFVKTHASETKFAFIADAKVSNFIMLDDKDFNVTVVKISKKLEDGKKVVAFKNEKCQGFFEIVSYDEEADEISLKIWIVSGNFSAYMPFEGEILDVPSFVMYNGVSYPVTSINDYFDKTNTTLKTVSLGENILSIDKFAFTNCPSLTNVYSYAKTPLEIGSMTFANMNGHLYVPCDYYENYDLHAQWGSFKHIECISSNETVLNNDDVMVTPEINNALFAMPINESANSYSLTISKDGEVFCILNFNANAQLTNIDFSSLKSYELKDAVQGFEFTVTGLSSASDYAYSYVAKDAAKRVIKEYSGIFFDKKHRWYRRKFHFKQRSSLLQGNSYSKQ